MRLAYDVCRCMGEGPLSAVGAGQNDFVICAERDTCARYLAAKRPTDGERVPHTSLLRSEMYTLCDYKIEVE